MWAPVIQLYQPQSPSRVAILPTPRNQLCLAITFGSCLTFVTNTDSHTYPRSPETDLKFYRPDTVYFSLFNTNNNTKNTATDYHLNMYHQHQFKKVKNLDFTYEGLPCICQSVIICGPGLQSCVNFTVMGRGGTCPPLGR